MGKKNMRVPIGVALTVLILLVVFFVLRGTMSRPARVVLPEENAQSEANGGTDLSNEALARIDVRPSTVQSAIATLARPQKYSAGITVERFYEGGSGVDTGKLYVSQAWTRADVTRSSGEVRHLLTDGEMTYIWYGGSREYYAGAAAMNADAEQGIPTYESVLALDVSRIAFADYRLLGETDCIYVETSPDGANYVERYWVSVGTGLLVAAEKLCGEETVYRMALTDYDTEEVKTEQFTLPDGTVKHSVSD